MTTDHRPWNRDRDQKWRWAEEAVRAIVARHRSGASTVRGELEVLSRHAGGNAGFVGAGKDRIAITDDDGETVLKLARSDGGIVANEAEVARWLRATKTERVWLAPLLMWHPDGLWVLMRGAPDTPDRAWMLRFERWAESLAPDRRGMPPRRLLDAVEHAYDRADWLAINGHPVLFDYS